jgi:hypothetical protein
MNRILAIVVCALSLLASTSLPSNAQVSIKYFNCSFNVKFSDGTSLTDSSVFFNGAALFTYNITSTNGSIPGFNYNPTDTKWSVSTGSYLYYVVSSPKDRGSINRAFTFAISNQGPFQGQNTIYEGYETKQTPPTGYRSISGGSSLNCLPFEGPSLASPPK